MTFREKLAQEHPEQIREEYDGGCCGCPSHYGYEAREDCPPHLPGESADEHCAKCWDREIPQVESVVHAHWRKTPLCNILYCSHCDELMPWLTRETPRCPICGAYMDENEERGDKE